MIQNQQEQLKLNIYIKTVWLAVRFNCKLSFVLKNDLSQVLAHTEYAFPLIRGEAVVNDYLTCNLSSQLYTPSRKLKIFVYLVSANGMVPAGFATLPPQNKQKILPFNTMLPLERCDDPKAQIKIIISVDPSSKVTSSSTYNESVKNEIKRFNSPISHIQNFRDFSRASYSATKMQQSRARPSAPSNNHHNIRQLKIASFQNKLQKQPESELSREQLIKEHQEYWVQIVRMEGENESLKEQINLLKNQNQKIKNDFQNIRLQNEKLRMDNQKIHALISQVNQGSQTIAKLENDLFTAKQKCQTSSNQCYSLTQELKRTQLQLKDAFQQTNLLSQRVQTLISEKQTNQQTIQHLRWQNAHIVQKIQSLSIDVQKLKSINTTLIDQNKSMRIQRLSAQLEIQNLKVEIQNNIELKKNLELSNATISQLLSQKQYKQNDFEYLRSELSKSKQLLFQEFQKYKQISSIVQAKQSQLQQLKQVSQHMKWQNANLNEKVEVLNLHKTDIQSQFFQSRNKIKLAQLQINQLKENNKKLIANLHDSESKLQSQHETNINLIKETQRHIKQLEQSQNSLNQQVIHLQKQNQITANQLKHVENSKQALKMELNAFIEKNGSLQQQFQLMVQLLKKEQQQKQYLTDSVYKLQQIKQNFQIKQAKYMNEQKQLTELYEDMKHKLQIVKQVKQLDQKTIHILEQNLKKSSQDMDSILDQLKLSNQQCMKLKNQLSEAEVQLDCVQLQLKDLKQKQSNNQYYNSYNKSITQLTMNQIKTQNEKNDIAAQYAQIQLHLQQKEKEINQLKEFTKNTLQQTLKLRKQKQELQRKLKATIKS